MQNKNVYEKQQKMCTKIYENKYEKKTKYFFANFYAKPLPKPGIEPGSSRTQSGCVTPGPPSQLKLSIVVILFTCFKAMVRHVNKQLKPNVRANIFNKFILFCNILHAWITYLQEL